MAEKVTFTCGVCEIRPAYLFPEMRYLCRQCWVKYWPVESAEYDRLYGTREEA